MGQKSYELGNGWKTIKVQSDHIAAPKVRAVLRDDRGNLRNDSAQLPASLSPASSEDDVSLLSLQVPES